MPARLVRCPRTQAQPQRVIMMKKSRDDGSWGQGGGREWGSTLVAALRAEYVGTLPWPALNRRMSQAGA